MLAMIILSLLRLLVYPSGGYSVRLSLGRRIVRHDSSLASLTVRVVLVRHDKSREWWINERRKERTDCSTTSEGVWSRRRRVSGCNWSVRKLLNAFRLATILSALCHQISISSSSAWQPTAQGSVVPRCRTLAQAEASWVREGARAHLSRGRRRSCSTLERPLRKNTRQA